MQAGISSKGANSKRFYNKSKWTSEKNVLFLVLTGTNKHNTVQKHKELGIYITNRIANYTTNHILKEKIRAIKDQQ